MSCIAKVLTVVVALLCPLTLAASCDASDETNLLQVKQIVQHAPPPATAELTEKIADKVEAEALEDGAKMAKQLDKDVIKLEGQATKDGKKQAGGKHETKNEEKQAAKDEKKEEKQADKDAKKDVKQAEGIVKAEEKAADKEGVSTKEVEKEAKAKLAHDMKDRPSILRGEAGLIIRDSSKGKDKKELEAAMEKNALKELKVDGAKGGHGHASQKDARKDATKIVADEKKLEKKAGKKNTKRGWKTVINDMERDSSKTQSDYYRILDEAEKEEVDDEIAASGNREQRDAFLEEAESDHPDAKKNIARIAKEVISNKRMKPRRTEAKQENEELIMEQAVTDAGMVVRMAVNEDMKQAGQAARDVMGTNMRSMDTQADMDEKDKQIEATSALLTLSRQGKKDSVLSGDTAHNDDEQIKTQLDKIITGSDNEKAKKAATSITNKMDSQKGDFDSVSLGSGEAIDDKLLDLKRSKDF